MWIWPEKLAYMAEHFDNSSLRQKRVLFMEKDMSLDSSVDGLSVHEMGKSNDARCV